MRLKVFSIRFILYILLTYIVIGTTIQISSVYDILFKFPTTLFKQVLTISLILFDMLFILDKTWNVINMELVIKLRLGRNYPLLVCHVLLKNMFLLLIWHSLLNIVFFQQSYITDLLIQFALIYLSMIPILLTKHKTESVIAILFFLIILLIRYVI